MIKDWNTFMSRWDDLHRNGIMPYIRSATKEQRKEVNQLLSDMKSSLKWVRREDCINIYYKLKEIIDFNPQ